MPGILTQACQFAQVFRIMNSGLPSLQALCKYKNAIIQKYTHTSHKNIPIQKTKNTIEKCMPGVWDYWLRLALAEDCHLQAHCCSWQISTQQLRMETGEILNCPNPWNNNISICYKSSIWQLCDLLELKLTKSWLAKIPRNNLITPVILFISTQKSDCDWERGVLKLRLDKQAGKRQGYARWSWSWIARIPRDKSGRLAIPLISTQSQTFKIQAGQKLIAL